MLMVSNCASVAYTGLFWLILVLSSHMEWNGVGEQINDFGNNPPRPHNPNILIAKLRPGQVSCLVFIHQIFANNLSRNWEWSCTV
jgi:hypothetical protein